MGREVRRPPQTHKPAGPTGRGVPDLRVVRTGALEFPGDVAPVGGRTVAACLTWRGYLTGFLVVVASLCCREWTNVWTVAIAVGLCAILLRQLYVAEIRSSRNAIRGCSEQSAHHAKTRAA